ncbi:MAG: putative CRISPR-associated protein [Desulfovermiculus sp.]
MYRDTLVCTVGTSLLGNLDRSQDAQLQKSTKDNNPTMAAKRLASFDLSDRILGAEINSTYSIWNQKYLSEKKNLYLLRSDTDSGDFVSRILEQYFQAGPISFEQIKRIKLQGLTDTDPERFRREGLRSLVRHVAEIVNRTGNNRIVINATGGYKAQISFAGMIGQALEIPVCYMFEGFNKVIQLPPQPISLDFTFWMDHVDRFFALSQDALYEDPTQDDPRFGSLVECEDVEGTPFSVLSPVGQLFHESFRYRFALQRQNMLPAKSTIPLAEKVIKYEDKNEGKHPGLASYLEGILKYPYVKRIYTHYYNPNLPETNAFKPSIKGGISQVMGIFSDGKATSKFDVVTTAQSKGERDAVLADLHEYISAQ